MKRLNKIILLFILIFSVGLLFAFLSINKSLSKEDSIKTVEVPAKVLKLAINTTAD